MDRHRRSLRLVALAVVVFLPLFGTSGVASAKAKAGCHKTHSCRGGGGSATGGATPGPMTIQIDPDPLVETSSSAIAVVIQVETSPSLAGATVDVTSSQLEATCSEFTGVVQTGSTMGSYLYDAFLSPLVVPLVLDDDGNAAFALFGQECSPGSSIVEASLTTAPYYTAVATLTAEPPAVTPAGVFGFPSSSGAVTGGEVETGSSTIYAVFYIETDPVYAEQTAELSATQLADRCQTVNAWTGFPSGGLVIYATVGYNGLYTSFPVPIDDDGNAVVIFAGSDCAAGSSVVTADVLAGTHPTYTTTFNVLPPQPTI
jgi:hypothetical protein